MKKESDLISFRLPKQVRDKLEEYCKHTKKGKTEVIKEALIKELGGKYIPERIIFKGK